MNSGPPIASKSPRLLAEEPFEPMRGVITNRDVVRHLGLIYREFGTRCVFRCLWVLATRRTTTFLDVVSQQP